MKITLHSRSDNKTTKTEYRICFDSKKFEDAYLTKYDNLEDAISFRDSFNKQERLVMENGGVHIEKWTLTKEVIEAAK